MITNGHEWDVDGQRITKTDLLHVFPHPVKTRSFYLSTGQLLTDSYFRRGSGELHRTHPTFFSSKKEAIKSAEKQGFLVL